MRQMRYYGYGDPAFLKILAVAGCGIILTIILLFTVVMPPGQIEKNLDATTTTTVVLNTNDSAISPGAVIYEYGLNSTIAGKIYSNNRAYLSGVVGNVEQGPNGYESCVELDSIGGYLVYGCSQAATSDGWVVWNWNIEIPVSSVPIDRNFVAECIIQGMVGGNLILDSCVVSSRA